MKPVNGIAKVTAATAAISVTFSILWGMATLGYPGSVVASTQLAAHTCAPR
jgi:hypothetical protein